MGMSTLKILEELQKLDKEQNSYLRALERINKKDSVRTTVFLKIKEVQRKKEKLRFQLKLLKEMKKDD